MDPYLERIAKYLLPLTQVALAFSGIGLTLATLRIFIWVRGDFGMFINVASFVNLISQASIMGIISLAMFLMMWIVGLVFFVPRTKFFSKMNLTVFTILPLVLVLMPWCYLAIYFLGLVLVYLVRKLESKFQWIVEARRNHNMSPLKILVFVVTNTVLLLGTSTGFASDVTFKTNLGTTISGQGFIGQNSLLIANPRNGTSKYFTLAEIHELEIQDKPKDANSVPLANLLLDLLKIR